MAAIVTRSIFSAKHGSTGDMLKPRSHDFSLQSQPLVHGAGADRFASTLSAENKWWQVIVGFDDANSVAVLTGLVDTSGDRVVKDMNVGAGVAARTFTWKDAVLMDVTAAERFAVPGEFAAVFAVPALDGATNPLTVTGS